MHAEDRHYNNILSEYHDSLIEEDEPIMSEFQTIVYRGFLIGDYEDNRILFFALNLGYKF